MSCFVSLCMRTVLSFNAFKVIVATTPLQYLGLHDIDTDPVILSQCQEIGSFGQLLLTFVEPQKGLNVQCLHEKEKKEKKTGRRLGFLGPLAQDRCNICLSI